MASCLSIHLSYQERRDVGGGQLGSHDLHAKVPREGVVALFLFVCGGLLWFILRKSRVSGGWVMATVGCTL